MKRVKLLELGMQGTNFDMEIPAGTSASHLNTAMALAIIDIAKKREISTARVFAEIQQWVKQLEDNQ